MTTVRNRNPLLPWLISLPIVVLAVAYVGYRMWALECAIPAVDVFLVLGVIPVLYLALMYLTFKSQR